MDCTKSGACIEEFLCHRWADWAPGYQSAWYSSASRGLHDLQQQKWELGILELAYKTRSSVRSRWVLVWLSIWVPIITKKVKASVKTEEGLEDIIVPCCFWKLDFHIVLVLRRIQFSKGHTVKSLERRDRYCLPVYFLPYSCTCSRKLETRTILASLIPDGR